MPVVRSVILDCDTGIDDALALLYLLRTPGVEVCAVTSVWGNTPVATATANNLRLLELAGAGAIPVARGASGPLLGGTPIFAPHVHGRDGLGEVGLPPPARVAVDAPAAALIVDLARARPGKLDLIAVGPLTNVALALALEPALPRLLRHVTIMGGAADAPGNVTAVAEANVWCDPEAALAVVRAPWPLTLVPLDVTMRELLTEAHRTRLAAAGTPVSLLAAQITDFYFDFFRAAAFAERCSPVHDALAAAIALGEVEPAVAPVIAVDVDASDGPGRGQTLCDTRGRYRGHPPQEGANCRVVLETAGDFPDRLVDRLCGGWAHA